MVGQRIGLADAVAALRAELLEAMRAGKGEEIEFPVGQVQLEFQVGVTRQGGGDGRLKFWVLEFGVDGSYANEQIQTITVTLEPPVDRAGKRVKVLARDDEDPFD